MRHRSGAAVSARALAEARKRRWARLGLVGIVVVQAALSLRLRNTAFQDEALYLRAGHEYLDQWFQGGGDAPGNIYALYFSGAPYLYPPFGALADSLGGLAGARALSLLCMIAVTCVVYAVTRRLFNLRAALFAAAAFAVVEPTSYMGNFATFDAPALLLIAIAFWIVVRFDRSADWPVLLTVPLLLSLAFATKYAAAMFAGPVIAFAVAVAWRHRGPGRALARGAALAVLTGVLIGLWIKFGGFLAGFKFTTLERSINTDVRTTDVLKEGGKLAGAFLLLTLAGAVIYVANRRDDGRHGPSVPSDSRLWRFFVAGGMLAAGLLVPLYQTNIHTVVALNKHVGFGMLFAAPIVGVGLAWMSTANLKLVPLPIALVVLLGIQGIPHSDRYFKAWPDSQAMTDFLRGEMKPNVKYLSSTPQVAEYYLGTDRTIWWQWSNTYDLAIPEFEKPAMDAIAKGEFALIVLDERVAPDINARVIAAIKASGKYKAKAVIPYGPQGTAEPGRYLIWGPKK
ncbi:ArnT family glycosyltransferase [Actinocorallia lasiicapitis]